MSAIITVNKLDKYFDFARPVCQRLLTPFKPVPKIHALKAVTFDVNAGEILGIVGPNGAGKTTLLRILADLLRPDQGEITLCGQTLRSNCHHIRRNIGYVSSDERSFFWRLTGIQNLLFFAQLYGIAHNHACKRINTMLKAFALEKYADQLFRDYSTGTRKKFSLIRALIHQPAILLLDELTNSLDPPSAQSVKSLIQKYVSRPVGCTAIWSTHRLDEVGEICHKVLALDNGRVRFFGSVSDLHTGAGVADCSQSTRERTDYEPTDSTDTILAEQ